MFLKLSILILVCVLIFSVLRKKIDTLLFVFSCLWTVVIFLYDLRLFDIFAVGNNTQLVVFGGVMGFLIGHVVADKLQFTIKDNSLMICNQVDTRVNYVFVNIVFTVVLIIAACYYIPNLIIGIKGGSAKIVKGLLMSGELSTGNVFVQYIARPFSKIMIATSAYCIINDRRQKYTIASGIVMVLFELLGMWSKSSLIFFALL